MKEFLIVAAVAAGLAGCSVTHETVAPVTADATQPTYYTTPANLALEHMCEGNSQAYISEQLTKNAINLRLGPLPLRVLRVEPVEIEGVDAGNYHQCKVYIQFSNKTKASGILKIEKSRNSQINGEWVRRGEWIGESNLSKYQSDLVKARRDAESNKKKHNWIEEGSDALGEGFVYWGSEISDSTGLPERVKMIARDISKDPDQLHELVFTIYKWVGPPFSEYMPHGNFIFKCRGVCAGGYISQDLRYSGEHLQPEKGTLLSDAIQDMVAGRMDKNPRPRKVVLTSQPFLAD